MSSAWNKRHPAYRPWVNMLIRCGLRTGRDEKAARIYDGITVCDEWMDFYIFEEWALSNGWVPRTRLAVCRVDKKKHYCPENCIIISSAEAQDYRSNVYRVDGKSVRKILGLGPGRVQRTCTITIRIRDYGWPVEEALTRDITPRNLTTKLHLKQKRTEK